MYINVSDGDFFLADGTEFLAAEPLFDAGGVVEVAALQFPHPVVLLDLAEADGAAD